MQSLVISNATQMDQPNVSNHIWLVHLITVTSNTALVCYYYYTTIFHLIEAEPFSIQNL